MPSFYKTNLMDGYDSLLIPPEKDDATFVINVNDANVEENTKSEKTVKKLAKDYPYKRVLKGSREIHAIALLIWYIFEFLLVPHLDVSNEKLIQEEILKPCIFTNAIQLNNLLKIELNNFATQTFVLLI
uniref:Uncharacterized protein n=1 Tax=Panagrolaimus superbus TaxID=310955 RepID=A0A914Y9D8_9BILA